MTNYPDLPLIEERYKNIVKALPWVHNVKNNNFTVDVFLQTWGSTALGFGGFGGQALTSAYTTVIWQKDVGYTIFFDDKFAYAIENPNDKFFEDLSKRNMLDVESANKYKKNVSDEHFYSLLEKHYEFPY